MRRRRSGRALVTGVAMLALAVPVLAGCADTQPGDKNNGPGYTNNLSDLLVKLSAQRTDPCRGAQADQIFANCGRFVTEVSSTVGTLRSAAPGQAALVNTLQNAVNNFQQQGCDSISGTPTAQQRTACPAALTTIGNELDRLDQALSTTQPSG